MIKCKQKTVQSRISELQYPILSINRSLVMLNQICWLRKVSSTWVLCKFQYLRTDWRVRQRSKCRIETRLKHLKRIRESSFQNSVLFFTWKSCTIAWVSTIYVRIHLAFPIWKLIPLNHVRWDACGWLTALNLKFVIQRVYMSWT